MTNTSADMPRTSQEAGASAVGGTMIRDYAERMENKAARLRDRAATVTAKGEAAYATVRRIGDMIPMGQPILIGHHSERRHRRDIDRIDRNMRASIEAGKTAKRLEAAADRAENPTAVSSDDPTAVDKLRTKLAGLEALQDRMRRANAIVLPEHRKGDNDAGKWQDRAVARLLAEGLMGEANARKLCEPDFANRLGFASYNLTNNGAEIRRVKARIETLERSAAAPEHAPVTIGDVEIREDKGLNRVQIVFPGKPSEAVRTKLKACGFRWCRSEGAWQRQASAGAFEHAVRVMREASEGAAQ